MLLFYQRLCVELEENGEGHHSRTPLGIPVFGSKDAFTRQDNGKISCNKVTVLSFGPVLLGGKSKMKT